MAVANFSLVQPKSAGGETLFSAKMSTIESPLSGLLTGMLHFCFCPQHMPFVLDQPFESGCIGSKIAIAIQEATIYMRLDSSGVPHWVNLLKVGAIQASKVLLSGTLLSSKLHPPFQAVDAVKDVKAVAPPPILPQQHGEPHPTSMQSCTLFDYAFAT